MAVLPAVGALKVLKNMHAAVVKLVDTGDSKSPAQKV